MHNVQDSKFIHEYMVKSLSPSHPGFQATQFFPRATAMEHPSSGSMWVSFDLPDSAWRPGIILFILCRLQGQLRKDLMLG